MTVHDFPATVNGTPDHTDTWAPVNLNQLPEKPPVTPTLGSIGIVYPGKRHVFSGPPESAKTLVAYIVMLEVIRDQGDVVLIDFEMGGYDTRSRFRELGATTDEINRVHYLEPDEPATDARVDTLVRLEPQLVVLDAAAGAYQLESLDDNKRSDVEKWSRLYVRRFWRAGIATIVIDHVPKDAETRGRYAIGSERKLGGADVHLGFDTITPISRGTDGKYKIATHKDRGGCLRRGRLADVHLTSHEITHQIDWEITAADTTTADDESGEYFRPTHLMEKVSIYVEHRNEPITRNAIADAVGGTKKWVLGAINALVRERFLLETDGAGRSKPVVSSRPYREKDPTCNPEKQEVIPVVLSSSRIVREPGMVSGSGGSPPYGGDTTEPHHPDHPEQGRWFADLTYLETIAPDPEDTP